jgi:hypothetical protein
LISVCPRHCICFCLPPSFLPAPTVVTAAICRRHCQCRRNLNCRPCSFSRHRCHRYLFFCLRHHCLYVSTFLTASMFQRFCHRGRHCFCFDRHHHHSFRQGTITDKKCQPAGRSALVEDGGSGNHDQVGWEARDLF